MSTQLPQASASTKFRHPRASSVADEECPKTGTESRATDGGVKFQKRDFSEFTTGDRSGNQTTFRRWAPFWRRINVGRKDHCWLWTGTVGRNGYGKTTHGGRFWSTHRLAWWLANGQPDLDRATQIRHRCDVRLCCNPMHLEPGSAADNADDAVDRGRTKGGRPAGSDHGNVIVELLALRQAKVSVREIALRLGMSERNVYYHLSQMKQLAALSDDEGTP